MSGWGVDLGGEGERLVGTWLPVTTQSTGCRQPCRLNWHETPNTSRAAKHGCQKCALIHNRRKRLGNCTRNELAVSSLFNDIVSSAWHHRTQIFLAICQSVAINPLKPELNSICYLLALLGAYHFLDVSRIRVKILTFRRLMSYIYGAPILDVSRSHTTTQHSR